MSDLSALANLSPEELEIVKALGANQGTRDPKQLPGRPLVWQVGNKQYLVMYIPGTQTPMVWDATPAELAEKFGGVDAAPPTPDRTMSEQEFQALAPWRAGRINEIRNTSEDPWTQFFSDYNSSAELRPWLRDPDMLATIATAFLEGRAPTADELSKTEWWNEHTADERRWLEESATMGADEMTRRGNDAFRATAQLLRSAGAANVPEVVVRWIANKRLTGQWSEAYFNEQVKKLADPYAPGTLNPGITTLLRGDDNDVPDTTRQQEDTVRELAARWLGPTMGNMSQDEIRKWAGKIRNDPDAQFEFEQHLRLQRRALFPKFENENLTYEDIVGPYRNLAMNVWGRPVQDEAMLMDLANLGDFSEAQKRLRKQGLTMGVQKVVNDAISELGSTALGDRVARSTI